MPQDSVLLVKNEIIITIKVLMQKLLVARGFDTLINKSIYIAGFIGYLKTVATYEGEVL